MKKSLTINNKFEIKPEDEFAAYYSSPASHSPKMKAYIQFFIAAEAGDDAIIDTLATEDIIWNFNAGSEVAGGLPWIGEFKGKKEIYAIAKKIKSVNIQVLSREYYLIQENESQLIVAARDDITIMDQVKVTNINFVNIITFKANKIQHIRTVEDNSKLLLAYQKLKN